MTGADQLINSNREEIRERLAKLWGHGEGPFYCDDEIIPGFWSTWERTADGGYQEVRTASLSGFYDFSSIPWLHCAICDEKLRKVGTNARCGRQGLIGTQARSSNPPPCRLCCETGRIVCFACCEHERTERSVAEYVRLSIVVRDLGTQLAYATDPDWNDQCYFVEGVGTGLVKIGYTTDLDSRFRGLVTMSPVPLQMLAAFRGGRGLEQALHEKFAAIRAHGEWFKDTPELRATIQKLEERRLEEPPNPAPIRAELETAKAALKAVNADLRELGVDAEEQAASALEQLGRSVA